MHGSRSNTLRHRWDPLCRRSGRTVHGHYGGEAAHLNGDGHLGAGSVLRAIASGAVETPPSRSRGGSRVNAAGRLAIAALAVRQRRRRVCRVLHGAGSVRLAQVCTQGLADRVPSSPRPRPFDQHYDLLKSFWRAPEGAAWHICATSVAVRICVPRVRPRLSRRCTLARRGPDNAQRYRNCSASSRARVSLARASWRSPLSQAAPGRLQRRLQLVGQAQLRWRQ